MVISDIEQLQQLIESKHIRPFWNVSKEEYQTTISKAREFISNKDYCDETCLVEFIYILLSTILKWLRKFKGYKLLLKGNRGTNQDVVVF